MDIDETSLISFIKHNDLQLNKIYINALKNMTNYFFLIMNQLVADKHQLQRMILTGGFIYKNPMFVSMLEKTFDIECIVSDNRGDALYGLLQLALQIDNCR